MARPVVVLVDADDAGRQALARELGARYGAHYRIMSSASPEEALTGLEQLRGEGAEVPLVLADQWMPGRTSAQFLARVRQLYPTARRVLLISWGDRSAPVAAVEAAALGQIDFYLPRPVWSPDEQFHQAITEALAEWWRQQGGQFAAVTVIGKEQSPRVHELRDLLTRNNVPFGFRRADSAEGSAALQRLGLDQPSGPVVTLYNGVVLTDPANAEIAEALGLNTRPPETTYDVVIVGAGPAGQGAAGLGG
jgi:thioredoxin reductase (NADPH)